MSLKGTPSQRREARHRLALGERCQSDRDGDCAYKRCPQLRDGEPVKSGRHCPLDLLLGAEDE